MAVRRLWVRRYIRFSALMVSTLFSFVNVHADHASRVAGWRNPPPFCPGVNALGAGGSPFFASKRKLRRPLAAPRSSCARPDACVPAPPAPSLRFRGRWPGPARSSAPWMVPPHRFHPVRWVCPLMGLPPYSKLLFASRAKEREGRRVRPGPKQPFRAPGRFDILQQQSPAGADLARPPPPQLRVQTFPPTGNLGATPWGRNASRVAPHAARLRVARSTRCPARTYLRRVSR